MYIIVTYTLLLLLLLCSSSSGSAGSLIKQPSRTGNRKVIKTFTFRRRVCVKSLFFVCLQLVNLIKCRWFLWMGRCSRSYKWSILLRRSIELVGKRIPNRCCLWLRRVGHISRACAYRVSGYTDSGRPYWLRNIIFFPHFRVRHCSEIYLVYTNPWCVYICVRP